MPHAAYQRTLSYKDAVDKHPKQPNGVLYEDLNGAVIVPDPKPLADMVDAVPRDYAFSWLDLIFTLVAIATFIFDIVTDIAVAVSHYNDGKMWYFGLTVVFIVFPMFIMTMFSFRWYLIDAKQKKTPHMTCQKWVLIGVLLVFQLTPLLRYGTILYYAFKWKKETNPVEKRRLTKWLVYEDADAAMLRLFESFLESAPQVILQLYILASPQKNRDITTVYIQAVSIVVSITSVAYSLVAQHGAMRMSIRASANMTIMGRITQFLWRFFDTTSRILVLGLFVSVFPLYFAGICAFRWLVMTTWIVAMKTEYCQTKLEELVYNVVLGGVFIFCYFNLKSGNTRWRYLIYYIYTFCENVALIVTWYVYSDPNLWYRLPAMYLHFLSFVVGLFFMLTYYVSFHPNGRIFDEKSTEKSIDDKVLKISENPLGEIPSTLDKEHRHTQTISECPKRDGEIWTPV